MTKRIKSKFKVCKKIRGLNKNLWAVHKASHFRSIQICKQNIFLVMQKKNRLTSFGRYLNTKQIIKNFYCNISEQNFQNYLNKSIISKATSLPKFFSLLESRVDTILYRSCLVNSLHMSRQLINHRLILLNKKIVSCSMTLAASGDMLLLNPRKWYFYNKLIKILKQRRWKKYYLLSCKTLKKINKVIIQNNIKSLNLNNRLLTNDLKKVFLKKLNIFVKLRKLKDIESIPSHLEVSFKLFKIVYLWEPNYLKVYFPVKVQYKKHFKGNLLSLNNILYKY